MSNSRPVYSTEQGRLCPACGLAKTVCHCKKFSAAPVGDGVVRVSRETKGRKGKGVTLISGIALPEEELRTLAKKLKQLCGTGGTVKEHVIEIQGDNRDRLFAWLQENGYKVKKSGG